MHVSLDLEELPPSLRRSLARWPRAQLPAVLIRLVELGLYQAVSPNDFNLRTAQLHDWLQQHQNKTGPRISLNSYNTFVQSPIATWVACPTANPSSTRRADNELTVQSPTNSTEIIARTDVTTGESNGQSSGFFSMLTAKLFGTRKSTAAPTAAPIAAISDTVLANNQYESDKGKGKKIRKKTRNPPSFSLRHIRNLSSEIGSPSSQGEYTLSRKSSRRSTQAVNENKSTWTSSVLRRFSKRRQLKSDAAELFDSNAEFDHLSIPRHIRANTMVEITNLSNPSLVPSINNAASAPACTCKKPDTSSSRRWTRLSWPWQLGAPSPPPPPPPPPQASASASPPGLCALHSPISSPAVSIRARHAPTLADFLLPSEMARLRHMEPPLDECDAREEQDEEEVEGEHYSYEMNEEDGHDTNSWPDFRDHASNSIREWVASIPKETPLSLANFALPVNDGPGTSTAPTRPISTSRRLCAIAPETAESDFTTTDATANDEYRYGPWADHESESSIGDELSMIESFGEDLLEQPGYNTSFGIRISPENVLGLVSNLLERGALDDSYLADDAVDSFERSQRDSSFEHNLHRHTQQQLSSYPNRRRYSRGSNYSAASNGNNGHDRHSDLLTWQEENPSNPTPEHVYCT